ncbi:MAG: hypothetical protein ACK5MI_10720, partial [Mangrovibacterium sp.]
MNIKFSILTILLLLHTFVSAAVYESVEKYVNTSCSINDIDELIIDNRFGNIVITDLNSDSIYVNVVIKVSSRKQSTIDQILDKVNIGFQQNGKQLKAVTSLDNLTMKNSSLEINYNVIIPASKKLDITNKYGNVQVDKLDGKGSFNVKYGNFNGGTWKTTDNIPIIAKYGDISIDKVNYLTCDIGYGNLNIEKIDNLHLDSKYSDIDISEVKYIKVDSEYDQFSFNKLLSLDAKAQGSDFNIKSLIERLNLSTSY